MNYPQDIETRLGFDKIKSMAERYCHTERAKEKVNTVPFSVNRKKIVADLSLTSEMKSILMLESGFPECKFVDLLPFTRRIASEGTFITAGELAGLRDGLKSVTAVVRFFENRNPGKYPFLELLVSKIEACPEVVEKAEKIIDDSGKIRDTASGELREIRAGLFAKEREASKKINSILAKAKAGGIAEEDASVSIRDGRAVIPVLAANKRKLKGLIHDESATGKTAFIEPEEVVEINNEIRELQYAEKREIIRILTFFCDEIRPMIPEIEHNGEFLATLDFIRAKAKTAIDMEADKPIISKEMELNLIRARHPLLEKTLKKEKLSIVPLDLTLDESSHILVISGPNAGGKSVCLKTVGLLQLMVQSGFLVPASANSEFPVFRDIFIDIGDQQSIDNDLSTYSSHLENMKKILRHGNDQSLVLIDEFGTGTEPSVGGAIAEAILEKMETMRVFGVITTHYTNLKFFANQSKGVINGAMTFDTQHIRPLFSLEIGTPGSSFAFEIAHKTGLPEEVIANAKQKVGQTQLDIEKQLREIGRDKLYWERKRNEIKENERKYLSLAEQYKQLYEELKTRRAEIIREAKKEAETILRDSNKIVEKTIREIKEAEAEKERTKNIRQELRQFEEELSQGASEAEELKISRKMEKIRQKEQQKQLRSTEKLPTPPIVEHPKPAQEITPGAKVRIKGQSVIGQVQSIEKNRAVVAFGHIVTTVKLTELEPCSENEYRKQQKDSGKSVYDFAADTTSRNYAVSEKRLTFKTDIDIRGMRVEEALPVVEKFVDEAAMLGYKELRILHGKGTGALKEEIRKYLRTIPTVAGTRDEHIDFGGAGITLVTLIE